MKAVLLLLVLLAPVLHAGGRDSSYLDLRGKAAFHPGDDEIWRTKFIDEAEGGWNFIPVPGAWERLGYPMLDGIGWYRLRFRIPASLRKDSLLLIMSGVDDADQTYLNGGLIGESGSFPPKPRLEPSSLRVYPIPRAAIEEYNLLAIRVFDAGDSGGITGPIFRIIRADSMALVLNEIIDAPFRTPPLFFTNGVMVSALDPVTRVVEWTKPHIFSELDAGLKTQSILASVEVSVEIDGARKALRECAAERVGFFGESGIVRGRFREGFEVDWYHPHVPGVRALVLCVRIPKRSRVAHAGLASRYERDYWLFREVVEEDALETRQYFILCFNACCTDLVERDLALLMAPPPPGKKPPHTLDAELDYWNEIDARSAFPPASLSPSEQEVYRRSIVTLLQAQSREEGSGSGQIVSALAPGSQAYTVPRDHLLACMALSEAGLVEEARRGLDFLVRNAGSAYTLYDVLGKEFGVGYPYLVTPSRYTGNGAEFRWQRPDDAVLGFDGTALYIEAVEALRAATRRRAVLAGKAFSDSAFIAPFWKDLSTKAANVLLYMRDSAGLIPHDGGPWGEGLSPDPGVETSLHAAAALLISARYAKLQRDPTKLYLYRKAADETIDTIKGLLASTRMREAVSALTHHEELLFTPLIIDCIVLGLLDPHSPEARFTLDMFETSFAIEDAPGMYNAMPDGDWFARQARPFLALRLARARAISGDLARAEALFGQVTRIAQSGGGQLPELVDPVTKNWHGGIPSVAAAAEYILAAETIARMKLAGK